MTGRGQRLDDDADLAVLLLAFVPLDFAAFLFDMDSLAMSLVVSGRVPGV